MARVQTQTGGRVATTGVIPGRWALSVGDPRTPTAPGFRWVQLSDIARLESGHTPSRRKPEYWDGDIPWIGIRDATGNHGRTIVSTLQSITEAGLENSSTRLLPAGTVCLSRTASVGYVITMGVSMTTSQDFVNWVCGPPLSFKYLHYILVSEQESIRRFAHGTTHQTVYYPEAKAFHVCIPERAEQDAIVAVLGALDDKIAVNGSIAATALELARCIYSSFAASAYAWSELGKLITLKYGKALRAPDRRDGAASVYGCTGQVGWHDTSLTLGPTAVVGRKGANAGWVSWSPRPCWVIDTAFFAEVKAEFLSPEVAFLMLETANLAGLVGDSAVPGLNREVVHRLLVKVPEPEAAAEVSERVRPLMARATQAEQESSTLAALRDMLLPQLMSGRLRVRDAEWIVEDAL
jgi:type I restriction enzyme S subunit